MSKTSLKSSRSSNFYLWSIPIGITVLGLVVSFIGVIGYIQSSASNNWVSIKATVVSSEKEYLPMRNSRGDYQPRVSYTYKIDSHEYTSNILSFGRKLQFQQGNIGDFLAPYSVGNIITVYYNPEQPSESVVLPGGVKYHLIKVLFGCCFIGAGLVVGVNIPRLLVRAT